jgi:hypothetical protein
VLHAAGEEDLPALRRHADGEQQQPPAQKATVSASETSERTKTTSRLGIAAPANRAKSDIRLKLKAAVTREPAAPLDDG